MKLKKLLTLVPLLAISLVGCDESNSNSPSSSNEDIDTSKGYDDGIYNDDIDNGYHYSISIDKSNVPEYLEVGGDGFSLKINMSTDEPGASTTPGEDTLVIHNTDSTVVQLDGLNVIPVGRGTTTLKVEWLHHSSCYDHVNVIVRNVGEVDESGYTYSVSILNKTDEMYIGETLELELEASSSHPDFEAGVDLETNIRIVSSDESIISVDGFKITALEEGRATIRAQFIGHESSCYDSMNIDVVGVPIFNLTLKFTLTYDNKPAECPSFGHVYMNYGLNKMSGTTRWVKLETLETVGEYSAFFESISAGDYEYQLCFVYDNEEPNYSHQLSDGSDNGKFTISDDTSDGSSISLSHALIHDMMSYPSHDVVLTNYTLRFNIVKSGYSLQTNPGMSLFITGTFDDYYWGTFGALEYSDLSVGDNKQYRYSITFSSIYPGEYEYKLTYAPYDNPSYDHDITQNNLTLTVEASEGNNYTKEIEIESDIWLADYWN